MKNNNIDIEKLRNYINDLEEQVTPLTKSKSKKVDQTVDEVAKTESADLIEDSPQPVPSKKKITRTVTEKKKEQLVKAREVKKENMEKRNKLKKLESAKLLLSEEISKPKTTKQVLSEASSSESTSEESESEEEVIVVKKKATKTKPKDKAKPDKLSHDRSGRAKPKKKKIIIEEDESSSSESSSSEEEQIIKKKAFGKSHRNKKSVVKVHEHPAPTSNHQSYNFFCD
jgi:hypothetical protein